jgi:hypothetical protein
MDITTIKISRETKQRLEKLREYKKESYEEVIKKILSILNMIKIEPERAKFALNRIDETRAIIQMQELKATQEKEKREMETKKASSSSLHRQRARGSH